MYSQKELLDATENNFNSSMRSKKGSIHKKNTQFRGNDSMNSMKHDNGDVFKPKELSKVVSINSNMSDIEVIDFLKKNIHYICKLQAWYRGNKARKRVDFMKSKKIGSKKYFTFEELSEININDKSE